MPTYIVGTTISTKTPERPAFDPLAPAAAMQPQQRPRNNWLPVDVEWILGRISQTPGAKTFDYMFYAAGNPQRTHTTTFETMAQADEEIARLRNEKLAAPMTGDDRQKVDTAEKFDQVSDKLAQREGLNRRQAPDPRRGGRPGNMDRRFGR
jgi:hypothetical protein